MTGDIYPNAPGFKASGTSQDAAERIAPAADRVRSVVLSGLAQAPGGMTADELAARLGIDRYMVRPRLSELVRDHFVEKTDERRKNASGMTANVYRVKHDSD